MQANIFVYEKNSYAMYMYKFSINFNVSSPKIYIFLNLILVWKKTWLHIESGIKV